MVTQELDNNMRKSVEASQRNFNTIRTGRANTSLLDRLTVEYYGVDTPLKSLATISTPDSQTISIQPFDLSSLPLIEKAISVSDLGFSPNNDGKVIRINIPPLTEERRMQLVKQVKSDTENCRVAIRNSRKEGNDELKKIHKSSTISDDLLKDAESNIQDFTNQFIEKANKVSSIKEEELMKV